MAVPLDWRTTLICRGATIRGVLLASFCACTHSAPPASPVPASDPEPEPYVSGVERPELAAILLAYERIDVELPDPGAAVAERVQTRLEQRKVRANRIRELRAQIDGLDGLSAHDRIVGAALQGAFDRRLANLQCRWSDWRTGAVRDPVIRDARDGSIDRLAVRGWVGWYDAQARAAEESVLLLRDALAEGFVDHRASVEAYLVSVEAVEPLEEPVVALLPEPRRDALLEARSRWRDAHAQLAAVTREEVLPVARPDAGLFGLPDVCYAASILTHTDAVHDPAVLHDIGLSQVARIAEQVVAVHVAHPELDGALAVTGEGAPAILGALRASPSRFPDVEALLESARTTAARGEALEESVFGRTSSVSCSVRPIGPRWTASWVPSGVYDDHTFLANTAPGAIRPWELPTITAHECSPGHHLEQTTRGETAGWPVFLHRRQSTAFTEGWAHYAETVAAEEGLFAEPTTLLGHLAHRSWRAARLVVDTGIHHRGWSDDEAIAYFATHTALDPGIIEHEVLRMRERPGQALAYKTGELELQRLRQVAESRLGEDFDRHRAGFHRTLLSMVGAPVGALAIGVDEWLDTLEAGVSEGDAPP